MLSDLVEEGMEQKDKQNKEEVTSISGVPTSRQESSPVQSSLGNTNKISPTEEGPPMPTFNKVIQSTIFPTQQDSTSIMPKGGKKSILNSVVKRNLKTKRSKHVVLPRPYPIPILPKYTGGASGEYDRQVVHQVHPWHAHAGQKIGKRS